MDIIYFFGGTGVGSIVMFWIITTNYKLVKETSNNENVEEFNDGYVETDEDIVDENFDDESEDNANYYYVKFPHQPRPIEVCVEVPLEVGHNLLYRNLIYKITVVLHKVDGHTIFVAEPKTESNGN